MFNGNLKDTPLRFDDWGPGYVVRGPRTDVGVCYLRPGDVFPNHYHERVEETFYVVEGEATLWCNCRESYTLVERDIHQCAPGEMHYFVNETDEPFLALFFKSIYAPTDKINVPWEPGQAVPDIPQISGD